MIEKKERNVNPRPPDTPILRGSIRTSYGQGVRVSENRPGHRRCAISMPYVGVSGRRTTMRGQWPSHVRVSGGLYRPRTDRTPADDRSQREANRISERVGMKSGGSLPKQLEPLPGRLRTEMKHCGKVAATINSTVAHSRWHVLSGRVWSPMIGRVGR